jgi:hypothetical protein
VERVGERGSGKKQTRIRKRRERKIAFLDLGEAVILFREADLKQSSPRFFWVQASMNLSRPYKVAPWASVSPHISIPMKGYGEPMDTQTILIIVLVVLLLGGGGFWYRGRRR